MFKRRAHALAVALVVLCVAPLTIGAPIARAQQAEAATDASVPPSVREIFAHDKIKVITAAVEPPGGRQKGMHYTFRVELRYDPQSSQTAAYYDRLYPAILDALGGAAYTLIDVTDAVKIDVHLDQSRNKMSVETSSLK